MYWLQQSQCRNCSASSCKHGVCILLSDSISTWDLLTKNLMLQLVAGKIGMWSQRCDSLIPCKPSKQHFFLTFFLSILTVLASLVMVLILLSDSFWYVLFSARNFDFKSCIALVWVLLITVTSPSKSFILDSCWFWRFCKIQVRRCHWVISSEIWCTWQTVGQVRTVVTCWMA